MKYRDLEMTNEQLREIIINKTPKFYEEFVKKGIRLYRGGDKSSSYVRLVKTKPERRGSGFRFDDHLLKLFDNLITSNGVASRIEHATFALSNDYSDLAIGVERQYWFLPIGDYKYSYLKDITHDFNFPSKRFRNAVRVMGNFDEFFGTRLLNNILTDTSGKHYNEWIDEFIEQNYDEEDISPSSKRYIENIKHEFELVYELFHISRIGDLFITNDNTLLKDNSSEVWFNCKSYLLIDAREYDLEEIFKEYYK